MTVGGWLRRLDDDALSGRLTRRFAPPQCTAWQVWWAVAGLLYGLAIGTWWVVLLAASEHVDLDTLLMGAALGLPWPALPLAWMLRFGRPRVAGLLTLVLALGHFTVFFNAWGLELLFLPLMVVGLMVAAAPGRTVSGV